MAEELRLRLLGGLRLTKGDSPVTDFVSNKVRALLCYLAVTGRPHARSTLAGLLWGETPEANAQRSLRVALSNLRRQVGPHLRITRQTVAFDCDSPHWLDVAEFEHGVGWALRYQNDTLTDEVVSSLTEAVDLYQGCFLEGFHVGQAPAFEEWVLTQQERMRELALRGLSALAAHHTAQGAYAEGIACTRRLLTMAPWMEEAHRQLMTSLALIGQRSAALVQYETCRRVLAEELDLQPAEATTDLYNQIKAGQIRPKPLTSAAELPRPAQHNLPTPLTAFVGRKEEMALINERLADPDTRLVTVVGPSGIGKTRLALEVARSQIANFKHGAYIVPLAGVTSADGLTAAIADSLSVILQGRGEPSGQLLAYLRPTNLLLVLDGLEAVRNRSDLLLEMLRVAPRLAMLVTSHEELNLQAESALRLRGLPFPKDESARTPIEYGAVQLFVKRARQALMDFDPSAGTLRDIVRICRLVEGMPLAIELAASWVDQYSCAAIADAIQDNFNFLGSPMLDLPERHRSLRVTFDHTWNLLSRGERRAFKRLSVFQGGFQPHAAEAVAGAPRSVLTRLAKKSLLRRGPGERFEIHELLRQYAEKQLARTTEERTAVRDRHSCYFASFLQEQEQRLNSREQKKALGEIHKDLENVRAGWIWAVEQRKADVIKGALDGLYLFYIRQGRFQEGEKAFKQALDGLGLAEADRLTGKLLARHGVFAHRLGLSEDARERLQESLTVARRWADAEETAFALNHLGHVARSLGEYAQAKRCHQESLSICTETGDRRGMADSLSNLGDVAYWMGDHQEAHLLFQESLDLRRKVGDRDGIGTSLNSLGEVAMALGDYDEAKRHLRESLTIRRVIGDQRGTALSLGNLGTLAYRQGDHAEAERLLGESLEIRRDISDRQGVADSLDALGRVAAALGRCDRAKQYLEESLAIGRELDDRYRLVSALDSLSEVALATGNRDGARGYLLEAARTALEIGDASLAVESALRTSRLLAETGEGERAEELLARVLRHPASEKWVQEDAERVLATLEVAGSGQAH